MSETNEAAERLRDSITEVLHRYECDDEPPGHDWHDHQPWDEKPHHPNRIDGLVDLIAAERRATVERIEALDRFSDDSGIEYVEVAAIRRAILDKEAAR